MWTFLTFGIPIVSLAILFATYNYVADSSPASSPGFTFFLTNIVIGLIFGSLGTSEGMYYFCTISTNNLCGMAGIALGLIGFGVGVTIASACWVVGTKRKH